MPYYAYGDDNPSSVVAEEAAKNGPTVYEYRPPPVAPGQPAAPEPYRYCDVRYIWSGQPLQVPNGYPLYNANQVPLAYPPHKESEIMADPVYMYYTQPVAYLAPPVMPGYAAMPSMYAAPAAPVAPPPSAPQHPSAVPWNGPTRAEIDARNAAIAARTQKPTQLIPFESKPGQQWWCREMDGSYVLRTTTDIMENCQPGEWKRHPDTGAPYFIRKPAA